MVVCVVGSILVSFLAGYTVFRFEQVEKERSSIQIPR